MAYLQPTDYANFGLAPDTGDDWVNAASVLIDSYCRRPTLLVAQYTERLRVVSGSQTVRLSYLPLAAAVGAAGPLVAAQARYARPRRGELGEPQLAEVAWAFSLPGSWTGLDPASLDCVAETGEVTLPYSLLGIPYNEVELTYTAGCAVIPAAVQTACAQIVKNAQTAPGLNVKSARMDTMQMEYFAPTLIDAYATALLKPYVANRLG